MELLQKIADIVEQVEEGNSSALESYILIQDLEKEMKRAKDQIKDLAIEEAEKEGAKTFERSGRVVTISDGRRSWKYPNTHQVSELQKQLKATQEMAKQAKITGKPVFDENGEQIEPAIETFSNPYITIK